MPSLRPFVAVGCTGCPAGTEVGGNRYRKAGGINAWPTQTDSRYLTSLSGTLSSTSIA